MRSRTLSGARLAGALLALCAASGIAAGQPVRIGTIEVRILDVFSPEEAAKGWVYRAADALHIKTREGVIRAFVLFHECDPYDPAALAETERNLRALPFVKIANVTAGPVHDGVVDVLVVTQDPWTLEPGLAWGSKGGVTTYGFEVQEKDLLGTGRGLNFKFDKGTDRTTRTLTYSDPALLGIAYLSGVFGFSESSDGSEQRVEVGRPFFSFRQTWSSDLLLDSLTQHTRLYEDGDLSEEFRQKHREARLTYGHAFVATDERAQRATLGIDLDDERFTNLPGREDHLPEDRRFHDLFLTYDDVTNDFVKMDHVNRDLRVEDFNLGDAVSATAGISPAVLGAPRTTVPFLLFGSRGLRWGESGFFLGTASISGRFDRGPRNTLATMELRAVRKLPTRLLQTFVARLRLDYGWRLYHDVQLFADGMTGLRAYRLHSYEGNKRVILNLEHRIFSGREILQLVSPGAAVFFDTGMATPEGTPLRFSDLRSDAGVGLRFGIARAPSNNILRIDFAYPFQRDPFGRKGWLVSFSSSQAF